MLQKIMLFRSQANAISSGNYLITAVDIIMANTNTAGIVELEVSPTKNKWDILLDAKKAADMLQSCINISGLDGNKRLNFGVSSLDNKVKLSFDNVGELNEIFQTMSQIKLISNETYLKYQTEIELPKSSNLLTLSS